MYMCGSVILWFLLFLTCVKMDPKEFVGPIVDHKDETSCEEFSKSARFNPYSVLNDKWFTFYYWNSQKMSETFVFTMPSANDTKNLHSILDNTVEIPVNWSARHVLMWDDWKTCHFLTERNDRGAYWLYLIPNYLTKDTKVPAVDIRLKQIGDNMYIGLMFCERHEVYALSKFTRIPKKSYLQDAAAKIGYRSRGGKSYLSQDNQWMPIHESSEEEYWRHRNFHKKKHRSPQIPHRTG